MYAVLYRLVERRESEVSKGKPDICILSWLGLFSIASLGSIYVNTVFSNFAYMFAVVSSVGSQTAVKGDKGNLLVEFPDKDRDCKKICIHFSPYKVYYCHYHKG